MGMVWYNYYIDNLIIIQKGIDLMKTLTKNVLALLVCSAVSLPTVAFAQ